VAGRTCDLDRHGRGPAVLEVQGEIEVGATVRVELGEPRQPGRQVGRAQVRDRPPAHGPAVVQHRDVVGRHPDVGLDAGRAHGQRKPKRSQRVLRSMSARTPMGEAERLHTFLPHSDETAIPQTSLFDIRRR
jgi:hypothetical protein